MKKLYKNIMTAVSFVGVVVTPVVAPAFAEQTDIRVLSYNINGLPAPLKKGKLPHFERIAEILRERRVAGNHPEIVVMQEAFDKKSNLIADTAGYPYVLFGPTRKDTSKRGDVHWVQQTRKSYASFSDGQKLIGSGLVILSDYPILEAHHKVFNSDECAGFDCLSNKAILMARVQVPGFGMPVDIVTSHFNSKRSAKAPAGIVFKAHQKQTDVFHWFLDKLNAGNPVIAAGDFNTKEARRYSYFQDTVGLVDSAAVCLKDKALCVLEQNVLPKKVLNDTNDKHFYKNGQGMMVDPIYIDRPFDEMLNGRPLSDHTGYEVVYRFSTPETLSVTERHQ